MSTARHGSVGPNAGHPPPLVAWRDAADLVHVDLLHTDDADTLLGIAPDHRRTEASRSIPAGALLVLYSDGLVERRDQSLDVGLTRLSEAVRDLARQDLGLDQLADQLLRRLLPTHQEDDVALVAVRVGARSGDPSELRTPAAGP